MKMTIDIVESGMCNYDGKCLICDNEYGYGWCYGDLYGTHQCPLIDSKIEIGVKPCFKEDILKSQKGV